MQLNSFLSFGGSLFILTALFGCGGAIMKAEYPGTWPSRFANGAPSDCVDISGIFKASNGDSLLPFFLHGIHDAASLDWANLVKTNEQILIEPDGSTVMIGSPNSDHIEVVVAMRGTPIAKHVLTRSRRSATAAEVWFGQGKQSFRCEPDGIVIVGAYVFDWDEYRLPYEEKKRRARRSSGNAHNVGTAHGYFDFSKASDGSLIMRQRLYYCFGCRSLDEQWRRWEPAVSPTRKWR